MHLSRFALAALLLAGSASHAADNCESIRAQIDAKVRASGVSNFVLSVVDADARAGGKIVGSCDFGTKRILYSQTASVSPAPPKSKAAEERILTECKDGSVTLNGDCRK